MTALEKKIVDTANAIPMTYGKYRLMSSLYIEIARLMGYEVRYISGRYTIRNWEEHQKVRKIIEGMENKGIIVKSKNKMAYRMV